MVTIKKTLLYWTIEWTGVNNGAGVGGNVAHAGFQGGSAALHCALGPVRWLQVTNQPILLHALNALWVSLYWEGDLRNLSYFLNK